MAITGRETITSLVTAVGLTASKFPDKSGICRWFRAVIQVVDGDIRFTVDGTDPVASTTGQRLLQDNVLEITGDELCDFLAIDDGGTAKLEVVYYNDSIGD